MTISEYLGNAMAQVKDAYTQSCAKREAKRKAEYIKALKESAYIDEVGGSLYIVCNGVAVRKINPTDKADAIVNSLNDVRKCALSYQGLTE